MHLVQSVLPRLMLVIGISVFGVPAAGQGSDRDDLIAQIETAGRNETDHRRHMVSIDDCTMKTHLWQNEKDLGWVLWSSFTFSMPNVEFSEIGRQEDGKPQKFLHIPAPHDGADATSLLMLNMRNGTTALYERSTLRKSKNNSWPSTRNDGTTHRFSESENFFIAHEGPNVGAKAQQFVSSFEEYVAQYCMFTG